MKGRYGVDAVGVIAKANSRDGRCLATGMLLLALACAAQADPAVEPQSQPAAAEPAQAPTEQKPQTTATEQPASQPVAEPAVVPALATPPAAVPASAPADSQPAKETPVRTEALGNVGGDGKAGVSETSRRKIRDTIRKLDDLLRR